MFRKCSDDGEHGFTMVELLVSIFLLSVVMTAVFSFLWGASNYWNTGQAAADVTDNARNGLNRMTREIKEGSLVTNATPDSVSFRVSFTGSTEEIITYRFAPPSAGVPGTLFRESSLSPGELILVNNVDQVQFDYYGNDYRCDFDANGRVIWSELQSCSADPAAKISRVDITMTMSTGGETQKEFFGQGWLRNRRTVEGA